MSLGGADVTIPPKVKQHQYLPRKGPVGYHAQSWHDRIYYETGLSYLSGLALGTVAGAQQGFIQSAKFGNTTLKMNAILNSGVRIGTSTGATFGIFAILYSSSRSFCASELRPHEDIYNDVFAVSSATLISSIRTGVISAAKSSAIMGGLTFVALTSKEKFLK